MKKEEIDWFKILDEPFVALILGQRGGGKTALGHLLLEIFSEQGKRRKACIYGFPLDKRNVLPEWIECLDDPIFPQDSVVLLHEAHFYLHARQSMESGHIDIDKLITVSRHKNADIIVETQQSFRLDRNIVAEVDAIIFRVPELMQEKFERPEMRWLVNEAKKAFKKFIKEYKFDDAIYREISPEAKKHAWIYSKKFVGMYPHEIPLPSYWNEEISRAYGEVKEDRIAEMKAKDPLIALLIEKPEYIEILQRALEKDIEKEQKGYLDTIGWDAYEIGATGNDMRKLLKLRVVEVVYKSGRHTGYRLKDREHVKKALSYIESLQK